jgi:hypothetical protein
VHQRIHGFVRLACLLAIILAAAGCSETASAPAPVSIAPNAGQRHKEMSDFMKNQPKGAAKASAPQTK